MKITLRSIKVRFLVKGYVDNDEEGAIAYRGMLNVRPAYQRELVYKTYQEESVIRSILGGFPLNTMYWFKTNDGEFKFELLDGQQRSLSICHFNNNDLFVGWTDRSGVRRDYNKENLPHELKEKFLNYKLTVYICEGTSEEVVEWYNVLNTVGEKLTTQEIRNAGYTGEWLVDAKRYFSKKNCAAHVLGKDYMTKIPERQEYLEKAIEWIIGSDNWRKRYGDRSTITQYMSENCKKSNADELKKYFESVFKWVKANFPDASEYPKYMKQVDWGALYNKHKNDTLDTPLIFQRIESLMLDDEVEQKKGIFAYVLDGKERHLQLRMFSEKQKQQMYTKQKGICPHTKNKLPMDKMEADHIKPWSEGGKTELKNGQMVCKEYNRRKSNK